MDGLVDSLRGHHSCKRVLTSLNYKYLCFLMEVDV